MISNGDKAKPGLFNRLGGWLGWGVGNTGYDVARGSHRRQTYRGLLRSSDMHARRESRRILVGESRDVQRNFSLAAWAIRQHLDFVSSFSFQCKHESKAVKQAVEEFVRWYSKPLNCDVRGMFSLHELVRMAEARRTVDGDTFLLKLSSGLLQPIEADRVRDRPPTAEGADTKGFGADVGLDWVHGVKVSKAGRPQRYAIWKRTGYGGYEYERSVRAGNAYCVGYYDRFDQVRGISPMTAALNQYRDLYENFDYALAKAKVASMFGIVFYTQSELPLGEPITYTDENGEQCQDIPDPLGNKYQTDFSKGPIKLELDPNERAEFLENKTPATEFQEFTRLVTSVAVKSLDIPYSFVDESHSNFHGQRGALNRYLNSVHAKREQLKRLLDNITTWRLALALDSGQLSIPGIETVADLQWSWLPRAMQWWNPVDEVDAQTKELENRTTSRQRICAMRGDDWFDIIAEQAEEEAELERLELTKQAESGGDEFDQIKSKFDAYGVGVRAGAITPQTEDEQAFRDEAGIPGMSSAVQGAWDDDGGFRRPITLQPNAADAPASPIGQPAAEGAEDTDEEEDTEDES